MGRLFLLLSIAAVTGLVMTNRLSLSSLDPSGVGTSIEGREVIRTADQIEARFTRHGQVDEIYMLFGGDAQQRHNQINHTTSLDCRSATHGRSPSAIRIFIAANRRAPPRRSASWRPRISWRPIALRGPPCHRPSISSRIAWPAAATEPASASAARSYLSVDSVRTIDGDHDLTAQIVPAFAKSHLVLAEEASIEDCQPLLR
ncbi:MAG: hypothetical protein GY910_14570 [bacterium]|nr:hypothetical protein [bacterium]